MRCQLLSWYEAARRPLPWRKDPAPYAVLVSEVMAQQTRMAQLMPFYARFMARFPTLEALAAAAQDDVLAVWAGIGYYARARNLHQTAKILNERFASGTCPAWPATRAEWEALPGIGPYTAGAVLSIAFGQKEAAVDGNVLRVAARLTGDETDITTHKARKNAEAFTLAHMPDTPAQIRAYTQALMELGAMVCVSPNPRCGECPLTGFCEAYKTGRTRALPVKTKKKPSPLIAVTVLMLISPDGRVLLHRRAAGLLKGMYVFTLVEGRHLSPREAAAYLNENGCTPLSVEPLGTFTHTFTHRIWHMRGYAVQITENDPPRGFNDCLFATPEALTRLALPAAMRYFL